MIDYHKLSNSALIALLEQSQDDILHLKNVLDHLPGSVYWKNKDGVYLGINQFATNTMKIMGYDWQNVVGKTDSELFPPEMADEFRRNDIKVMESGQEVVIEERSITINGDVVIQLSTKKPFYDRNGEVAGIIANTINITRLKEIEVELKEAKETAELANQLKLQIIHNMEHDIRTPFAGILAMSNLLSAREEDADKKEKLDNISECAHELLDYCNELIEVINIESNKLTNAPVLFCVRDLVENLIKAEKPAATIRGLKITFECDSTVPHYLLGDRVRLYRILLNLLSNAVKFTTKGEVNIRIRLADVSERNQVELIFEVHDTGIGIPKDKHDYIFEKFARITPANHGVYKGTGLGLSFVKKFVEDMGGSVWVDSELGKGACFSAQLPFYVARQDQVRREDKHDAIIKVNKEKPRILLIEDHIISRKVSKQVLEDVGCIVDAVDCGHDAIGHAKLNPYDLILVDIGLPDIDGFTVINTIRKFEHAKVTPISILTAHSSNDYRERALTFNVDKFVVKPLTAEIATKCLNETICPDMISASIPDSRKANLDGLGFYYSRDQDIKRFHDIFYSGYFHFSADKTKPLIVDGNANVGLSTLYFKLLYPDAEVICFEPDVNNFKLLRKNCRAHKLKKVTLKNEDFIQCYAENNLPLITTDAEMDPSVETGPGNVYNQALFGVKDTLDRKIDLLKLEFTVKNYHKLNAIQYRFAQVNKLLIVFHVNDKTKEAFVIDHLKKTLIPFYKKIKVAENPNMTKSRQHLMADINCTYEDSYFIYANN